jgi:hypothetical protein
MVKNGNECRLSVENVEGKRHLGTHQRTSRWEDNIKIDIKVTGLCSMDWIDLVHVRGHWRAVVNTEMNLRVPLNVWKFLGS